MPTGDATVAGGFLCSGGPNWCKIISVGWADLFRRRAAIAPALPLPRSCDFITVDFETANSTRGSACAVGVAVVSGGEVVAEGSTLIDPECEFDAYCTAVNGLDERDVKGAPTLPQIWGSSDFSGVESWE